MKKKPTGLYVLSLLLLFMLSLEKSCIASSEFNITPDNLKGIYYTFYNNQKAYAVSGDQYYQTKLNVWDSGEEIIYQISDNQWEEMAQNLNIMMTQAWITSGEFFGYNTTSMNDSNLWVTVIPTSSQTNTTPQIGFIFLPQITVTTALLENKGNYSTSSFYSVQPSFYLNSGEPGNMFVDTSTINATKSPAIELRILSNGNYSVQIHNSQTMSKLNSLGQFFRQWNPITYDTSTHYVSYYGIMTTYRDDYNLTLKGQSTFKRNYANTPWMQSYNGYRYNLGTNTIYSGDYIAPTPTPIPTSSGNGGITQGEVTQSMEDYWGKSGDLNGEKQEEEITNAVNGIMDNISGDFSNNAIVKTLESGEAGFLSFFESGHEENWYDLKFSWGNIDLDYKWNNEDVNGQYFISGDSINISAMCREVPILGTIQTLIRTIFNFSICMMLVKQIWNLLLATLGIDNPYLYENPDEEDISFSINENTGGITKTVRKGKITRRKTI